LIILTHTRIYSISRKNDQKVKKIDFFWFQYVFRTDFSKKAAFSLSVSSLFLKVFHAKTLISEWKSGCDLNTNR